MHIFAECVVFFPCVLSIAYFFRPVLQPVDICEGTQVKRVTQKTRKWGGVSNEGQGRGVWVGVGMCKELRRCVRRAKGRCVERLRGEIVVRSEMCDGTGMNGKRKD